MLSAPQSEVCLDCHGSLPDRDEMVRRGLVTDQAEPKLLGTVLSRPAVHPIDATAFSRHEPNVVTCTSCHSPHRSPPPAASSRAPGEQALSTRDPTRVEHELCDTCHAGGGLRAARSPVGDKLDVANRSFHPVRAPARGESGSVLPDLVGRSVNCSDCHGNSDPDGPRGPHGSDVAFLLRAPYVTVDGASESEDAYGLCYGCHDRERVLESIQFPEHRRHVVDLRTSCGTCHDAHGSVENRALIRFGDYSDRSPLMASARAGRLAFDSNGSGAGACYVTCHGYDHAPATYGGMPTDILQKQILADPDVKTPRTKPGSGRGSLLDQR
jgi:hypothetical protein